MADNVDTTEATIIEEDEPVVSVRDASKREIDVRLLPWNTTISTREGQEEFAPGSFAHLKPDSLYLMPPMHAGGQFAIDGAGEPTIKRVPAGRSTRIWEDSVGPMATFRVARTAQGEDVMALAEDGILRSVSIEYEKPKSVIQQVKRAGRTVQRVTRAHATGAVLTYRPAYGEQATVLAIRSQEEEAHVADENAPAATGFTQEDKNALITAMSSTLQQPIDAIMARLESIEERERQDVQLPATRSEDHRIPTKGEWAHMVLRVIAGERIPAQQMRDLDEVVTTDNLGVVPPAYLTEIIGVIDASRPFLSTTRRLTLPNAGMEIIVPVINQRPEVDIQDAEKDEVASRETHIGTQSFGFVTIAGAGDISIQLLRRSSPAFLGLWVELLAEAYAQFAEEVALNALANAMGGWGTGTNLDLDDADFGSSYVSAFDAMKRPPDTIWLSTQAVGEAIDAKASASNLPLYSTITASATAAGGITGTISGLRAVHVPTLDAHGAFAIVGPSAGFGWVEDGPLTLTADIPAKAGRDVGIVGLLAALPMYPSAFTLYDVTS